MVASARADLFRRYELTYERDVTGELSVNPLYRIERRGESSILTLTFPTPEYEAEFGECRRYLPDRLTVDADLTGPILRETLRVGIRGTAGATGPHRFAGRLLLGQILVGHWSDTGRILLVGPRRSARPGH